MADTTRATRQRTVYFIQSHRDPEQVYRLVRTLRRGSARALIVVQHNARAVELDWRPLEGVPDVRQFFARGPQLRSHYSCQVEPYLDVIAWLDREGIDYDWIVNLTAQDYPVKPVAALEALLERSDADGYLRYWDVLSVDSPWSRSKAKARYWHRYWRLPDGSQRILHATALPDHLPAHPLLSRLWTMVRRAPAPHAISRRLSLPRRLGVVLTPT